MKLTPDNVATAILLCIACYPAYLAVRTLLRGFYPQRFDDYKTPQELLRGSFIVRRKPKGKK